MTNPLKFQVNGRDVEVSVDEEMPLLWVLRDVLFLSGTKYGCGQALCGACTVHLDGEVIRSCVTPVRRVVGKSVTTIEGLSATGDHPLQKAWVELSVPQCGFCQAGQIMSAAALLRKKPKPSSEDIDAALAGNLCRCGTYTRIRTAILQAANAGAGAGAGRGGAGASAAPTTEPAPSASARGTPTAPTTPAPAKPKGAPSR
jgi:isoquinoline 1-oxidoreductase subunit alpha